MQLNKEYRGLLMVGVKVESAVGCGACFDNGFIVSNASCEMSSVY